MTSRVVVTSYGRSALGALRNVVSEFKHADPMTPVTILVPHHIAGTIARRHLAGGLTGRGPGVSALYVTTLPRLAEQIAASTLHPRRPATQPVVAAAWRAALDTVPGRFATVKDHPATIRALSQAHQELRDLSVEGRARAGRATALGPDLLGLHEAVSASLADG